MSRDPANMSRDDSQRSADRHQGLVAAGTAFGAVGRIVLLQWRGAAGIAAADGGVPAGRSRRPPPAAAAGGLPDPGWRPFFALAFLNNVLPFSLIVIGQTYVS